MQSLGSVADNVADAAAFSPNRATLSPTCSSMICSHSASRSLPNRVKDEGCSMKIAGVRVCFGSSSESEGYPSRSRSSARVSLSSGQICPDGPESDHDPPRARPGRRMAGRLHSAQSEPAWSAPTQPAAPASPFGRCGAERGRLQGVGRAPAGFLGRLVADVLSHDQPRLRGTGPPVTGLYRYRSAWDKNAPSLKRAEVPGTSTAYAPSSAKSITSSGPSIRGSQHYQDQASQQ